MPTQLDNPFADGIRSLGNSLFNPEARAKGEMMRDQLSTNALQRQKLMLDIGDMTRQQGAVSELGNMFGSGGLLITNPDGTTGFNPKARDKWFQVHTIARPNAPDTERLAGWNDYVLRELKKKQAEQDFQNSQAGMNAADHRALPPRARRAKAAGIEPTYKTYDKDGNERVAVSPGFEDLFSDTGVPAYDPNTPGDPLLPPTQPLGPNATFSQIQSATDLPQGGAESDGGSELVRMFKTLTGAMAATPGHRGGYTNDAGLGYVPRAEAVQASAAEGPATYLPREAIDQQSLGAAAEPSQPSIAANEGAGPMFLGGAKSSNIAPVRQRPIPASATTGMLGDMATLQKIERAIAHISTDPNDAIEGIIPNPDALGKKNLLPEVLKQEITAKGYQDGWSARDILSDISSVIIHDLSGAAVTNPEWERLREGIANSRDKPHIAVGKLKEMKKQLQDHLKLAGRVYSSAGGYVTDPSLKEFAEKFGTPEASVTAIPGGPMGNTPSQLGVPAQNGVPGVGQQFNGERVLGVKRIK